MNTQIVSFLKIKNASTIYHPYPCCWSIPSKYS